MTDLSLTVAPKSDQLNYDDLIAGPRTITVTRVSGRDTAEQPIAINFEGDSGKPYMPCKSMRRVLIHVWGKDGSQYPGRSMTLYGDPDVQFGGLKVGGIRISHMSGLSEPTTLVLTATRASRKPFTVKPLAGQPAANDRAAKYASDYLAKLATLSGDAVTAFRDQQAAKVEALRKSRPELAAKIDLALSQAGGDDDFSLDGGRPDDAHGDQHDGVLDQALAAIEKATTQAAVDAIVSTANEQLTMDEQIALSSAAMNRISALPEPVEGE